jgi:hypothetical protein
MISGWRRRDHASSSRLARDHLLSRLLMGVIWAVPSKTDGLQEPLVPIAVESGDSYDCRRVGMCWL